MLDNTILTIKNILSYSENYKMLKNSENYKKLNSNMAQQILKEVDESLNHSLHF